MNPARIQIQEVERDVTHIRDCHDEVIAIGIRRQRQQKNVEDKVRQHGTSRRAVAVHGRQIFRKPAVLGSLVQRPRRTCQGRHNGKEKGQNHQDDVNLGDHPIASKEATQGLSNASSVNNGGLQKRVVVHHTLESQRDEQEESHAREAGRQNRLHCVPGRVLQFARVADGRLERVGGPSRHVHGTHDERPASHIPSAIDAGIWRAGWHDRLKMIPMHCTSHKRNESR
mmetsp:Transcript_105075/g.322070  ORF Transcript_105075/g.322070 Transcript_105075/m.322070 type:complete len:227 (+) Transcript_105075:744-1424(+)